MFGFGKKREKLVEEHRIPLVVPSEFSTGLAVNLIVHKPNITFTESTTLVSFAVSKFEYKIPEHALPNWRANLALSDDNFPDLERHGLIPKKPTNNKMLDDFLKTNRQTLEKQIIESDLRYYHIPHNNEDITVLQKRRREKEYENQARATKTATVNFLFQVYNQLRKQINWDKKSSEIQDKFLPKLPRLPSDIVKLIASYFSFEDIIIRELEILFSKTAITTSPSMKSMFFKPVVREKLQKLHPLMLTDDSMIPSNELAR